MAEAERPIDFDTSLNLRAYVHRARTIAEMDVELISWRVYWAECSLHGRVEETVESDIGPDHRGVRCTTDHGDGTMRWCPVRGSDPADPPAPVFGEITAETVAALRARFGAKG